MLLLGSYQFAAEWLSSFERESRVKTNKIIKRDVGVWIHSKILVSKNHSRFGIDTATSKSQMMSRIIMEVESEICERTNIWQICIMSIQCWTLQTQMCGLAFSCTEMLHDRDYLLIVSLPLLFLPHTYTLLQSYTLFTPQSYHVGSTESFSFTSYSSKKFEVTATVSYDQCSCSNRWWWRRQCNNNGDVLSTARGTTRLGRSDCYRSCYVPLGRKNMVAIFCCVYCIQVIPQIYTVVKTTPNWTLARLIFNPK